MSMILDETYRKSTQYRQWSYTEETLAQIRQSTNDVAATCLREKGRIDADGDIQTLTAAEELCIVEWSCMKILEAGRAVEPPIPSNVTATAIQYLRRFYLTNSAMAHHPKTMLLCALFLAAKADHFYLPLSKLIYGVPSASVSPESVKAEESLLLQGLGFALDVRHPMKGLVGGCIEMHTMAAEGGLGSISEASGASRRIDTAADQAKELLMTAALLTDAYFLYTPSQIWLAAMALADRGLVKVYLDRKLADLASTASDGAAVELRAKLMPTISACARLLESYRPPDEQAQIRDLSRIREKLDICQKLMKVDVALPAAGTSITGEGEGGPERPVKRRRLGVDMS